MKLSSSCLSEESRRRSRQIGGLRVEVLEGNLSKNQTTGEVKIREVTFELLREVGFRLRHANKISRPNWAAFCIIYLGLLLVDIPVSSPTQLTVCILFIFLILKF